MLRHLNLLPLLIIPVLTTAFVLREDLVETPWSAPPKTAATLPPSESFTIKSSNTGETYLIQVQVPHDYNTTGDRYPVFYAVQGNPVANSYDEIVAPLLRRRRVPDVIYVNITIPAQRQRSMAGLISARAKPAPAHTWIDDLTFHPDPEDTTEGGNGEAFVSFLEKELIPRIDTQFHADPADRGIGGIGLGGLFAIAVSFRHPGLFERAIAISPRVYFADFAIIDDLRTMNTPQRRTPGTRLYVAVGDGDYPTSVRGFEILRDTLAQFPSSAVEVKTEMLRGRNSQNQFVPAAQAGLEYVYAK